MTDMVTLKIDQQTVTVPAGTLVVDAARIAGINIPVFCYCRVRSLLRTGCPSR